MTEPKIRFKQDDGSNFPEWEEKKLGEVCEPLQYGMGASATEYDGENKYIRITDIDESSHKYIQTDIVSPSGDLSDKYLVNNGDILLARTGASTGKSYLYDENDGKMYFAGFLIRAHVKEEYSPYFIFAQTLTEQYEKWVQQTSMRGAQPGINSTEYSSYCFKVPSLPEQQLIADFLSTVDEVIATSEEEVANLEKQKKAAMQKIFSQEVRFKKPDGSDFPEWEEKRIGDICNTFSGGTPRAGIDEYYTNGTIPFIRSGEIHDDKTKLFITEAGLNNSSAKMVEIGDILMALYGATSGEIDISKINGAINQAILCMRPIEGFVRKFIVEIFSFNKNSILETYLQGGQGNLSAQIVLNLRFNMPNEEEQKLIADFFTSFDEAITAAKQELESWKLLKKGLLQKMFV